jgi:hypothetical protein
MKSILKQLAELNETGLSEGAYEGARKEIDKTISSIHIKLGAHAKDFYKKPDEWDYTGDLNKVISQLKEVEKILG